MKILNSNPIRNTLAKRQYLSEKTYTRLEKASIAVEYGGRKVANKMTDTLMKVLLRLTNLFSKTKNDISQIVDIKKIKDIPDKSALHMLFVYTISKLMSAGKEVEINVENNELADLIKDNKSTIFIMNHDKQKEDAKLLSFFSALLAREYIYNGQAENGPKPKIILNRDILDSASTEKQVLGEKWGAVGVDASIHATNHIYNGKATAKLIKDLVQDKINLFIFPEGRMCAFKNLDPQWKFQSGIADIIRAVAQRKGSVRVVPLGFAYKKDVGSIHIGTPLYFKQDGDKILFKDGIVDENLQDKQYIDFMKNANESDSEGYRVITDNGEPVPARKSREYVSGVLCENLTASKKKAAEQIKDVGTEKDNSSIYVLSDENNE